MTAYGLDRTCRCRCGVTSPAIASLSFSPTLSHLPPPSHPLSVLSVQSAEVTEAEGDALEELGLTDASCAAEVIPKDLCV